MKKYRITVNENEIQLDKGDIGALDIAKVSDTDFHLLQNNQAYKISLLGADYLNKSIRLSVNGNTYKVKIEDEFDRRVLEMGLFAITSPKVNSITAPMPGLIIDILVKEGQEITEGAPLLVLSAMKMENVILSHGSGIVKSIAIKNGDAVEKGQLIIEME